MDKDRTCNECKITKPLTEFYKRRDDFTKRCKECVCRSERLRYKIKVVENGTYQCYEVGLDDVHQVLSWPELKALMHQHNIPVRPHSNKPDIVETLKQHGILPENYDSGPRRASVAHAVGPQSTTAPKASKRLPAQKVELTDMSDGTVTIYPSLYKTAKFLGTYNHNITKHNGLSYTACNGRTYKIKILPAVQSAVSVDDRAFFCVS